MLNNSVSVCVPVPGFIARLIMVVGHGYNYTSVLDPALFDE